MNGLHGFDNILFWPDLATCHYKGIVQDYLRAKNVEFVQKKDNPPNVPQARGIEKFLALCKREYLNKPHKPITDRGFKLVWYKIIKYVAEKSGKQCIQHASKVMRENGYKGLQTAMCALSNKNML
jgi:hypothetical protein